MRFSSNPGPERINSFDKGSSGQFYPISKMGFTALLRQTYLDADWYQSKGNTDYRDNSLEAWIALQDLPQFFDAPGWLQVLRADQLGDEFGKQYIIRGNGNEYQRLAEIKATNAPLIIPINFPDAYDVSDPYDAQHVALEDMMHWGTSPHQPWKAGRTGHQLCHYRRWTQGEKRLLEKPAQSRSIRALSRRGLESTYLHARATHPDRTTG